MELMNNRRPPIKTMAELQAEQKAEQRYNIRLGSAMAESELRRQEAEDRYTDAVIKSQSGRRVLDDLVADSQTPWQKEREYRRTDPNSSVMVRDQKQFSDDWDKLQKQMKNDQAASLTVQYRDEMMKNPYSALDERQQFAYDVAKTEFGMGDAAAFRFAIEGIPQIQIQPKSKPTFMGDAAETLKQLTVLTGDKKTPGEDTKKEDEEFLRLYVDNVARQRALQETGARSTLRSVEQWKAEQLMQEEGYTPAEAETIAARESMQTPQEKAQAFLENRRWGSLNKLVNEMNEEERKQLRIVRATAGDVMAERYLEQLAPELNERRMRGFAEFAEQYPVLASLGSVAINTMSGIGTAKNLLDVIGGRSIDPYSDFNMPSNAVSTIRGAVADKTDSEVLKFLYNTGMSALDMAAALFFGQIAGSNTAAVKHFVQLAMASPVATSATLDAVSRGVDDKTALIIGGLAAMTEYATEAIGLDELLNVKGAAFARFVSQFASESGEELLSSVINTVLDVGLAGDKSQAALSIDLLMKEGLSRAEAEKAAAVKLVKEMLLESLAGGITGGLMALPGSISIARRHSANKTVEAAKGDLQNVIAKAEPVVPGVLQPSAETVPQNLEVPEDRSRFDNFYAAADGSLDVDAYVEDGQGGLKTVSELVDRYEQTLPNDTQSLVAKVKKLKKEKAKVSKGGLNTLPLDIQLFAAKRKLVWNALQEGDILTGDSVSNVYDKYSEIADFIHSEVISDELLRDFLAEKGRYNVKHDVERDANAAELINTDKKKNDLYNELMAEDGAWKGTDEKVRAAQMLAQELYDKGEQDRAVDLMRAVTRRIGTEAGRALRSLDLKIEQYDSFTAFNFMNKIVDMALSEQLGEGANGKIGSDAFYDVADNLAKSLVVSEKMSAEQKSASMRKALEDMQKKLSAEQGKANRKVARAIKRALKNNGDLAGLFDTFTKSKTRNRRRTALAEYLGLAYLDADTKNVVTDLFEKLKSAETNAQRYALTDQVYTKLAEKFPVTMAEKFNTYRRIALLSNPKTHIKNALSNIGNMPQRKITDLTANAIERLLYFGGKGPLKEQQLTQRVGWSFTKHGKAIADVVDASVNEAMEELSRVKKYDLREASANTVKNYRKILNTETGNPIKRGVLKAVEKAGEFESFLLEKGDDAFVRSAYRDTLGQIMTARGMTEVTDGVKEIAMERALIATFKAENVLSDVVREIRNINGISNTLMDAVLPFTLTPTNITMEALRYSPLNAILGAIKTAKAIRNGGSDLEIAQAINSLAKGVTGTVESAVVAGIGYLLSKAGIIALFPTDYPKEDKEKSRAELTGSEQYAVKIGDWYVSLDWIQPAVFPLLFGAAVANETASQDKPGSDKSWVNLIGDALTSGYNSVFDMSVLSGMADLFKQGDIPAGVIDAFASLPGQYYPALFSAITRAFDTKERSYEDIGFLESVAGKIGVTSALPEKTDIWGNPVYKTAAGDNVIGNALINLLSPSTLTSGVAKNDPLTQEVLRLFDSNDENAKKAMPSTDISGWDFITDSETKSQALNDLGNAYREAAEGFVLNGEPAKIKENNKEKQITWDDATDSERISALYSLYNKAKELVKEKYEGGGSYSVAGVRDEDYSRFKKDTQNFVSEKYTDKYGKEQTRSVPEQAYKYIQGMDISEQEKADLWAHEFFMGEDDREKRDEYADAGLDEKQINLFAFKLKSVEPNRHETGKNAGQAIDGSKKEKACDFIDTFCDEQGLGKEVKYRLYEACGYSESAVVDTPWWQWSDYKENWFDDVWKKE